MNITITDAARDHIKALQEKAPQGAARLRLSIKTTGCSGNSYAMEYATEPLENDDLIENNDAAIYIPKIYSWMLIGMTIDYITDALGNSRFDFQNPNETGRCGCGESFHVEREGQGKDA